MNNYQRMAATAWALLMPLLLVACVALESPKTFNEKVAYGYSWVTTSRNVAAQLLQSKRIDKDDAVQVQAFADQARSLLDVARATAAKGDPASAESKVELALSVLAQVDAFLKSRQK